MGYGFAPYVSVATRRARGKKKMEKLRKNGLDIQPIEISGRKITRTFWGEAWCDHLEKFSDYSNRLPRGRTYVRNGSVCHLEINKGSINAYVAGSDLYQLKIKISPLAASRWQSIKKSSAGQIGSLLELLQGKISKQVMEIVSDQKTGLFPSPKEITLDCNCPDGANMCKHVAAVLYGIGAKLDQQPELLFILRGVDHHELIDEKIQIPKGSSKRRQLGGELSDIFGIELDESSPARKTTKKTAVTKKKTTISPTKTKQKTIRPTGKTVARMRKRFAMNLSQFSRLVGVSPQSISNWENHSAKLNLKPESLVALNKANMLDKIQAWESLEKKR